MSIIGDVYSTPTTLSPYFPLSLFSNITNTLTPALSDIFKGSEVNY